MPNCKQLRCEVGVFFLFLALIDLKIFVFISVGQASLSEKSLGLTQITLELQQAKV